jgi:hypothetical protein
MAGATVVATLGCLPVHTCISKSIVLEKGIIVAWIYNKSSITLELVVYTNTRQEATFPFQILLKIKQHSFSCTQENCKQYSSNYLLFHDKDVVLSFGERFPTFQRNIP